MSVRPVRITTDLVDEKLIDEKQSLLRIPAGDPRRERAVISNPLSEDQSVMRTTLLG